MEPELVRAAWRKRMATMLWRFRRLRGRWPDHDIREAAKRGMERAIQAGMKPPVEH